MRLFSDQAGGTRKRATTLSKEGGRRGMALLMVLTSIAVLTAVAVEFAYDTQVDTTLAANARDELRAEYMARSATNLSRLLLHFQYQLDRMMPQGGGATPPGQPGAQPQGGGDIASQVMAAVGGSMPRIQLYKIIPVESGAITTFIGAAAGPPAELPPDAATTGLKGAEPAQGLRSFGSFEGGFSAEIQDEETKLNLNQLSSIGSTEMIVAQQLDMMWGDPRWDFLFNEENSHGERLERKDLVIRIRDYVDADEVETSIDPTNAMAPFSAGFADEVGPYTDYRPDYKPKNAAFDSINELYMVAGMSDRMMAAFGDRFTVYTDINAKLNVNTQDPMQQLMIFLSIIEPTQRPLLMRDPNKVKAMLDELALTQVLGPFMPLTVQSYVGVATGAGFQVVPEAQNPNSPNAPVSDKAPQTFTIKATGQVGDVTKTLTTVVRYDDKLGKLLYYREE